MEKPRDTAPARPVRRTRRDEPERSRVPILVLRGGLAALAIAFLLSLGVFAMALVGASQISRGQHSVDVARDLFFDQLNDESKMLAGLRAKLSRGAEIRQSIDQLLMAPEAWDSETQRLTGLMEVQVRELEGRGFEDDQYLIRNLTESQKRITKVRLEYARRTLELQDIRDTALGAVAETVLFWQ